jgi:RNA polymerase-binding transcription factor DksA
MDRIQAAPARELAIDNLDRSARRLRQIDDALRRLDTGEYGTCGNCEDEIGAKRGRKAEPDIGPEDDEGLPA